MKDNIQLHLIIKLYHSLLSFDTIVFWLFIHFALLSFWPELRDCGDGACRGGGCSWAWCRPAAGRSAAKCRKRRAPSRLHRRARRISRSRRREHVFICMFYPSAALNPTHPDRKVRSAARRARAPSPPLARRRRCRRAAPTHPRNFVRSRRARTYAAY